MAAVNQSFGLGRDAGQRQLSSGKSFFITNLLQRIVFAESGIVGVNKKAEKLIRWGRLASFIGLGVVFVSTLLVWTSSVRGNYKTMAKVETAVDEYKSQVDQLPRNNSQILATVPAMNQLRKASSIYDRESHGFISRLGLYDGGVDEAADKLYKQEIGQRYMPAFDRLLQQKMRDHLVARNTAQKTLTTTRLPHCEPIGYGIYLPMNVQTMTMKLFWTGLIKNGQCRYKMLKQHPNNAKTCVNTCRLH